MVDREDQAAMQAKLQRYAAEEAAHWADYQAYKNNKDYDSITS